MLPQRWSPIPGNKPLWKFLAAPANSEFYPFGKMSWARASESIKEHIGNAVAPNGSPESVLGKIAQDARAAEDAE
ncbi:hypothetical protein [Streptomyces sp. NPDC088246]|uniref:hypothetical protein n=1 Tax=Streptomyces sp. NPDC088246 TaxID=3365842 RepID=UPI003830125E